MKIQKELDETKIVLHKTIESVLERGEKIDTLVEKSDGLNAQSKMFYKQVSNLVPLYSCIRKTGLGATCLRLYFLLGQEAEFVLCSHVIYQAK